MTYPDMSKFTPPITFDQTSIWHEVRKERKNNQYMCGCSGIETFDISIGGYVQLERLKKAIV